MPPPIPRKVSPVSCPSSSQPRRPAIRTSQTNSCSLPVRRTGISSRSPAVGQIRTGWSRNISWPLFLSSGAWRDFACSAPTRLVQRGTTWRARRKIVFLHENRCSRQGREYLGSPEKSPPCLSTKRRDKGRGTQISGTRRWLFGGVHPEKVYDALGRIQQNDASAQDYASPITRQAWQTGGADAGQRLHFFLQAWRQRAVALQLAL